MSVGRYDGTLRELILLFKYSRLSLLGRPLGRLAAARLKDDPGFLEGVDALVPVPLHRRRRRERGFNQSAVLAREISRAVGPPVLEKCLVRTGDAPPQVTLEAEARERNVRGLYTVRRPRLIEGRTILVVDDVFTTGATLGECSRVLAAAGAKEVRGLTLARA